MSRGWLAFMWAIIGAVVGQLLGVLLAPQLPFLKQHIPIGLNTTSLDLAFLVINFGFQLKLTIGGAVGLVLALWLALRNS